MESQPCAGSESCSNCRVESENRLEERGSAPTKVVNDDRASRNLVYIEISEGDRRSAAWTARRAQPPRLASTRAIRRRQDRSWSARPRPAEFLAAAVSTNARESAASLPLRPI